MHRTLAVVGLVAVLTLATMAASAQTRVGVRVEPDEVRVGETVQYTLTIEDGTVAGPLAPPPATGGLALVQRTPTSDRSSTVNGRTDRRVTWTYRATAPGEARLGSLTLRVGRFEFVTDEVRVAVRAPAPSAVTPRAGALPSEAVALRVQAETTEAIVGQQIVVEVVLYTDPDAQPTETRAASAWNAPGFWREALDTPDPAIGRTIRDGGRERVAYVVERVALFPTRAGTLTLAPRELRVALVRYDAAPDDPLDPFGGWFRPFLQRRETVTVASPALTIRVAPPPAGAPPTFAGAVGRVTLDRRVDRTAAAPDEPVTVTLALRGTANLSTLAAPTLEVDPAAADVFDPSDARTADRDGARLTAERTWTWTLVPTGSRDLEIPPLAWSVYDPDARRYVTLTAPGATVRVSGATATAASGGADPGLVLRTSSRHRGMALPTAWLWTALAFGVIVPLVVGGGRVLRRRWRGRPRDVRPTAVARPGHADIEARVRRACAERWGVHPGTPADALAGALLRAGADAEAAQRVATVIAQAQRARFTPGLDAPAAADLDTDASAAVAALGTRAAASGSSPVVALAVGLLLVGPVAAQTAPDADLFEQGVRLVAEGDTAGAVAAWQAVSTPDADHNVGVVALARRDAARARVHLERAARAAPFDAATRAALTEARQRVGADRPTRAEQVWAVLTFGGGAPLVAMAVLLSLVATVRVLSGRRRGARVLLIATSVAALAAALALVEAGTPRGVVVAEATVQAAPTPDAPDAGSLPVGTLVRVGTREAGWREVSAGGVRGWLPERAVAR